MEPNSVKLTFYTIDGKETTKENENVVHYAPIHLLGPFRPATVRSVEVGHNVTLYGNILNMINGIFVQEYIHLRAGKYTFKQPFQWLTMHIDILLEPTPVTGTPVTGWYSTPTTAPVETSMETSMETSTETSRPLRPSRGANPFRPRTSLETPAQTPTQTPAEPERGFRGANPFRTSTTTAPVPANSGWFNE